MRIVQTVFGVFHHFELAQQLWRRGHLQKIYSTWPWMRLKREGLPRDLVETFPWFHTPEMLMQRFGVSNAWALDQMSYASALSFDIWTSRQLRRQVAPEALIALSGSSLKTDREIQARGGRFVSDRGSSHQRYTAQVVPHEYRRCDISRPITDIRDILREEKIYEIADAITVPSSFAARSFLDSGLPPEKIHVIPYAARLEDLTRLGEPPTERFEVLFAGSVGLRKAFPYLLQPFANPQHSPNPLRSPAPIHPH